MANNSGDSIRAIARFFQVTRPQRQPEDVSVEADEADAVTTPPELLKLYKGLEYLLLMPLLSLPLIFFRMTLEGSWKMVWIE